MRRIFIFIFFIVPPCFAQQSLNPLNHESFQNHIFEILKRNVTIQNIRALRASGYTEQDIEEIIRSPNFQTFLTKVVHTPTIENMVRQAVNRLLTPGYLEAELQKRIQVAQARDRQDLLMALQELTQYRNRPSRNLHQEPETFFSKLWKQVKKDLFG